MSLQSENDDKNKNYPPYCIVWREKMAIHNYNWKSTAQIGVISEMFYFKKKERRKQRRKGQREKGINSLLMCLSWKNTKCLSNLSWFFLRPLVSIHTGILLPDNETVKMVVLFCAI